MLLSIVTCTYNCSKSIRETLLSIELEQKEKVEHIIIDGNSKDGTLKVLEDYKKSSDYSVFVDSGDDEGIYDAMNKGLKKASGKFILFLLSGDKLLISIDSLIQILNNSVAYDIIAFSGAFEKKDGEIEFWNRNEYKITPFNPAIRFPCLIIKNCIYKQLNFFNLRFKISSDFELISRYLKSNNKIEIRQESILLMESFGFSNNPKNFYLKKKEHRKIVSVNSFSINKLKFYFKNYKHILLYSLRFLFKFWKQ